MNQSYLDRISIVISVYNCDHLVKRCIDSLITSLGGLLPEFIIVDNAAANSTQDLIRQYSSFGIKYHAMPKDAGFAGANNVGYRYTTKEFVVLVNSDTVFHENPFPDLITFMDSHPKAMIAQGTVALENGIPGEDGLLDTCGGGITTTGRITNPAEKKDPSDPAFSFPRRVFYAYGALFLFRREAVSHANGFLFRDEFYAYYEETDFCHRIWLSGHEVWYVPTPIVGHAHTATFKKQYKMDHLFIFVSSNRRSSFLSCLQRRTLLIALMLSESSQFLLMVNHLAHGHITPIVNYLKSWSRTLKTIKTTFFLRRSIQRGRVTPDRWISDNLIEKTSFSDFIRQIRGFL